MKTFEIKITDLTKTSKNATDSFLDKLREKKNELDEKKRVEELCRDLKDNAYEKMIELLSERLNPIGFEVKKSISSIWITVKGLGYGEYLDEIQTQGWGEYEVDGTEITNEPVFVVKRSDYYAFRFSEMDVEEICTKIQENAMLITRAVNQLIKINL